MRWLPILTVLLLTSCLFAQSSSYLMNDTIESKIDSLLNAMTLQEKIGQLNQLRGQFSTGTEDGTTITLEDEIRNGRMGSVLNADGLDYKKELQRIAVEESRMGIPLILALDIIHGFKTIFPIPFGQSASWDIGMIEKSERIAAIEGSADGFHWTFSPMVDIARDPRWGRVMEGSGEDTYLATKIAVARVKGFQGDDLSAENTILACAKHFAAYGAAEAGKEYNTIDVSEIVLREVYLPPFKAACDAGVGTFMNAFNVVERVPASCSKLLVKQILKTEWGFEGFTISDWNSFGELIPHGVAKDGYEAAKYCFEAESDADMMSRVYIDNLEQLVKDGVFTQADIDKSARRVLRIKFLLGLFDDPYKYFDEERQKNMIMTQEHLDFAKEFARETFVLLKNEANTLPLKNDLKTVALIGPMANDCEHDNYMGTWSAYGDKNDVVTIYDALKDRFGDDMEILTSEGCQPYGVTDDTMIQNAVEIAKQSDVVILAIGENGDMSGEAKSRTDITLPGDQEKLVNAILETGKPVVAVIFSGRPLVLTELAETIPAMLAVWQPGTMGGPAIVDVLFGECNPSGKLTMTFPRTLGQVPLYYNALNTGRPRHDDDDSRYISRYIDESNHPLYPFGYGLSYTTFEYSDITLNETQMKMDGTITVSVDVTNTGDVAGKEVVQLYIRDLVASVSRPVKELKAFEKIALESGETKTVTFELCAEDLKFHNADLEYVAEPGTFKVFVGTNSAEVKEAEFELL